MKATRKNLCKLGLIKTKVLSLKDFGIETGFFYKDGDQLMQDTSHALSSEDFKKSYNDYLNDTDCFCINDLTLLLSKKDIGEDIYLIESTKNGGYCFFKQRKTIEKRIFKKVGKNKNICMKYANEWHRIEV